MMNQPERSWVTKKIFGFIIEDKVSEYGEEGYDTTHETVKQSILKFECMIWLELGNKFCKNHGNIYKEHINYLKTYGQKPHKYSMIE